MSRVIIIWKIWHQNKKRFKHAGRSPVKFFFSFIINISGNKNSVLPQLLIKIFKKWENDLASGQYTRYMVNNSLLSVTAIYEIFTSFYYIKIHTFFRHTQKLWWKNLVFLFSHVVIPVLHEYTRWINLS